MSPLLRDCLEINREEPVGGSNLPAQPAEARKKEQCLRPVGKVGFKWEDCFALPHSKNLFSHQWERDAWSFVGGSHCKPVVCIPVSSRIGEAAAWFHKLDSLISVGVIWVMPNRESTLTSSAWDGLDSLWGRLHPVSHSDFGKSPGAVSAVFTATWGGKHKKEVFDLRIIDLRVCIREAAWRMSSSPFAFVACWACSLHGKIRRFLFIWSKRPENPEPSASCGCQAG